METEIKGPITLSREIEATQIPMGWRLKLPAGSTVRITQSLGGSYTVTTDTGYMVRIDAQDADALGITPSEQPAAAATPGEFNEQAVWEQMKQVYDPEIPVNIVDLGLIYSCDIKDVEGGKRIEVKMSMTAPGCGMGNVLKADVEGKLSRLPTVKEVQVEVVFDPPWNPGRMSEAAKLQLGFDSDYGQSESTLPIYREK
jgi:probable FeS assembly SUF system protein SufT